MERVLISACLTGEPVRHDGGAARVNSGILERWRAEGRLVLICPEVAGGLAVPRAAAEIQEPGSEVPRVMDLDGKDVTAEFLAGARQALEVAQREGIRVAVLKDGSPSCGSTFVYDGTFRGVRVPGRLGVTAALLRANGIAVFSEGQLDEADEWLRARE